jgi:hypothetical protein
MATVLEQERGCEGSIPRVHIHGGPVLCSIQEDCGDLPVLKTARTSRMHHPAMLNVDRLLFASPRTGHTDRDHCLNRSGHVLLPEMRGYAGHSVVSPFASSGAAWSVDNWRRQLGRL